MVVPAGKDPWQGVKVAMISNNVELKQYDDPEGPYTPPSRQRCCYVEATTGAAFAVRVTLDSQFDLTPLKDDYALSIAIRYDGSIGYGISRKFTSGTLHEDRNKGHATVYLEAQSFAYDPATDKTMLGKPTFSDLTIQEECEMHVTPTELKGVGEIIVTLQILSSERRARKKVPPKQKIIKAASEKALKGSPLTNTVSVIGAHEHISSRRKDFRVPIHGRDGEPLQYRFKYRSHRALQILGCIPRSSSPEANLEAENAALRAEVAALRSHSNTNTNIKAEPERIDLTGIDLTSLKRERFTHEDDVDQQSKRSRYATMSVIELSDSE